MSEVVERVARAIATADERNGGPPYELRIANKHSKEHLFDEARAAIEAMRAPTIQMTQAACDATFGPAPLSPEAAHSIGYRAMITEALK